MKQGRIEKIGHNRTQSGSNTFSGPGDEVTKSVKENPDAKKQAGTADRSDRRTQHK